MKIDQNLHILFQDDIVVEKLIVERNYDENTGVRDLNDFITKIWVERDYKLSSNKIKEYLEISDGQSLSIKKFMVLYMREQLSQLVGVIGPKLQLIDRMLELGKDPASKLEELSLLLGVKLSDTPESYIKAHKRASKMAKQLQAELEEDFKNKYSANQILGSPDEIKDRIYTDNSIFELLSILIWLKEMFPNKYSFIHNRVELGSMDLSINSLSQVTLDVLKSIIDELYRVLIQAPPRSDSNG